MRRLACGYGERGNAAGNKGLGVAWSVRVLLTSGAHVKSPPDTPTTGLRLPQKGIPRDLPSFAGWVQSLTYGMALLGLKGHKGHSSERGGQTRASLGRASGHCALGGEGDAADGWGGPLLQNAALTG